MRSLVRFLQCPYDFFGAQDGDGCLGWFFVGSHDFLVHMTLMGSHDGDGYFSFCCCIVVDIPVVVCLSFCGQMPTNQYISA